MQGFVEHALTEFGRFVVLQILQIMADIGTGLDSSHKIQPGRIGVSTGSRNYFHGLAIQQRRTQRCKTAVNFRRNACVTNIGMHGIGKVHRRRAACQFQYVARRGEHIHLVRKQIYFYVLKELQGVSCLALHLQQFAQPFARTCLRVIAGHFVAALV